MSPDSPRLSGHAPASRGLPGPPTGRSSGQGGSKGLTVAQREQTVKDMFASFPWEPSRHEALSRWETRDFFALFLK